MKKHFAVALIAAVALATPASAVTILFGGADATPTSLSGTVGDVAYTLTAASFTVAPGALTSFSQLGAPLRLRVSAPGVGVLGGASNFQVDTNNPARREAFVLSTNSRIAFAGMRLSYVDADDTLALFGVMADGKLVPLVNSGTIRSGLGGAATVVNQTSLNDGTSTLDFANDWGWFDRYVFTTRVGGDILYEGGRGQGYRLDSINVGIVPEPATWALLITGFAMVGFSARRRLQVA